MLMSSGGAGCTVDSGDDAGGDGVCLLSCLVVVVFVVLFIISLQSYRK